MEALYILLSYEKTLHFFINICILYKAIVVIYNNKKVILYRGKERRGNVEFRKTNINDLPEVMKIIREAQSYFKEQGIDQWQNNYPNEEVIKNDIKNNHSYVLVKDGKIAATTVASFNGEKTYDNIYEGKWLSEDKYIVIHRVAVASDLKGIGLATELMKNVEKLALQNNVYSIKGDTHEDNKSMQRMFEKNGFVKCGVIYLEDKNKRIAFEKRL